MLRAVELHVAVSLNLELLVEALEVIRPRTTGTKDDVAPVVADLTILVNVSGEETKR